MSDLIKDALHRLNAALDRLDAVSIRHVEAERVRGTLETELAVMREDRHALANLLDNERDARARAEDGLAEIAPRVDRAISAIRQTLNEA